MLLLTSLEILTLLFYFSVLVYALSKRTDRLQAKTYAVAGIATLFVYRVVAMMLKFVVAHWLTVENAILGNTLILVGSYLASAVAVCLLIAAAFSRPDEPVVQEGTISDRIRTHSENPYAPPS